MGALNVKYLCTVCIFISSMVIVKIVCVCVHKCICVLAGVHACVIICRDLCMYEYGGHCRCHSLVTIFFVCQDGVIPWDLGTH